MGDETAGLSHSGLRAAGVRRTRHHILGAARRHLIEAGFHRLSLDQVARDAGVTRVTVYRHFGSKLGLLDAVAADLAERAGLVAGMEEAATIADPVEAFRAMVGELCRFWSTDPEMIRRLIGLAAVDPEAKEVIDRRDQWRIEQVATFVHRLEDVDRCGAYDVQETIAIVAALTSFPCCDELAARRQQGFDGQERLILRLLGGVVRLD